MKLSETGIVLFIHFLFDCSLQLAMFLHPGFRELNGLGEEVVESTKQHIIDYIESSMLLPPEPKRLKMDARFTCYANRVAEPCRDKYDRYLSTAVADSDPLIFWKSNSATLPILAKLAKRVLSVPPTSAPSERSFSMASHVVSSRRTSLRPGTVDNVLFLHSHRKTVDHVIYVLLKGELGKRV